MGGPASHAGRNAVLPPRERMSKNMKAITRAVAQYFRRSDRFLLVLCLCASSLGILLVYGIYLSGYVRWRVVLVQALATGLGLAAAVIISLFDYRFLAKLWKLYLPASMALVALTYVFGQRRAGYEYVDDAAWLEIPFVGLTFQPSELLKMAFILAFALYLERVREYLNEPKTLISAAAFGAVPVFMILLQGDGGTAMVFAAIFAAMVFAAGLRFRYIALAAGCLAASSPLIWYFLLDDDKRSRILTVFNPQLDPTGSGWQQGLGALSIGSGQIWGKGLFTGEHHYVPEMHNDFIFAFAGEALGFVGCALIVALLGAICIALLLSAKRAKDPLGRYICIGVFATIAFQTVINLGMCLSLAPVVGVTLPLISAGGTSVVGTYAGIGLALSVYRNSFVNLFLDR